MQNVQMLKNVVWDSMIVIQMQHVATHTMASTAHVIVVLLEMVGATARRPVIMTASMEFVPMPLFSAAYVIMDGLIMLVTKIVDATTTVPVKKESVFVTPAWTTPRVQVVSYASLGLMEMPRIPTWVAYLVTVTDIRLKMSTFVIKLLVNASAKTTPKVHNVTSVRKVFMATLVMVASVTMNAMVVYV
jgi:hypothetical protein